jgi:colanic acid biosynthesis protein WcaH
MSDHPSPARIPESEFLHVVRLAPVVAIDLVVRNAAGEVLLGLRNNEPARKTWFVPGGRVLKDERLDAAFARISADELGVALSRADARFLGIYEHVYEKNFAGAPGFGTHYVVLAHEIAIAEPVATPADDQHGEFRWWRVESLLDSADVHPHTKAYFATD